MRFNYHIIKFGGRESLQWKLLEVMRKRRTHYCQCIHMCYSLLIQGRLHICKQMRLVSFYIIFVVMGQSTRGFLSSIRPVIAVDGMFLKGKYRGSMFVVAANDGNNQIYPLAFGIMDSENDQSWCLFTTKLRSYIGEVPDLVFIFDRRYY